MPKIGPIGKKEYRSYRYGLVCLPKQNRKLLNIPRLQSIPYTSEKPLGRNSRRKPDATAARIHPYCWAYTAMCCPIFHYMDFGKDLLKTLKRTHQVMWEDIHHALYPGMRVQRELDKRHKLDVQQAVSPIVFTGLVGGRLDGKRDETPYLEDTEILKKRYWCGQTSQAWIDLQAVEVGSRF